jgi:diaminopropionate ammonia-lyase
MANHVMLAINQLPTYRAALLPEDAAYLDARAASEVEDMLRLCPAHRPTPLVSLDELARSLGVQRIYVKDESTRLGLGSFKALGGVFAVGRVVLEQARNVLGRTLEPAELLSDAVRGVARSLTICCATDGNHGRSVAAGARMLGARAVIFVHEFVSAQRVAAIAAHGAEVRQVAGNYDDCVALAFRESATNGWTVVSDTSAPGYEDIPRIVMQGYTAMVREVCRSLQQPPSHVFVQAGVGGLAAAVAGHLSLVYGVQRPSVIAVEPERAACLYASHQAGRRVAVAPREPTIMAMLECYEPSLVAWRVLSRVIDAFMLVAEEDAVASMRQLATPVGADLPLVSGESGAAGLAGLLKAVQLRRGAELLGLDRSSRVLLFSTEGATDPASYQQHVGRTSQQVLGGAGAYAE